MMACLIPFRHHVSAIICELAAAQMVQAGRASKPATGAPTVRTGCYSGRSAGGHLLKGAPSQQSESPRETCLPSFRGGLGRRGRLLGGIYRVTGPTLILPHAWDSSHRGSYMGFEQEAQNRESVSVCLSAEIAKRKHSPRATSCRRLERGHRG